MKIIVIIFFFSLMSFVKAQEWVSTFNGGDNDVGNFIDMDNSGNVCVAGTAGNQLLIIKYNSSGTEQWLQRFANPYNLGTTVSGISIDNSNNICVTGIFQRTFDTVTFMSTSQTVIFLSL